MADITAGLPTLRPEEEQAKQDRARLAALGGGVGAGAQRLGAAFNDIFTMPARGVMGAANTLLRAPNAFGAGIPYIPDNGLLTSPTPYSDQLTARGVPFGPESLPTRPATTAPASALPAMTAPAPTAAPVQAAAAPGTPKSKGTKTPAGMPAGAPAPLIPGETGFYMGTGDQLVPYGTRFNVGANGVQQLGGGGGDTSGLPGGGKMKNGQFVDPRDALEYGFRLQTQYRDESINAILASAGNGGDLGFRAKIGALAQAFGQNNFGATSVGGANSLNQAIAHITGAEVSAGATMGAAGLGLQGREAEIAAQRDIHATDSVQTGTVPYTDPTTRMTIPMPTYGQRPAKPGAMPLPYGVSAEPKRIPGKEYTDAKGNRATLNLDGSYTPVK